MSMNGVRFGNHYKIDFAICKSDFVVQSRSQQVVAVVACSGGPSPTIVKVYNSREAQADLPSM